MRDCIEEVVDLLKAKIDCIWLNTLEEVNAINDLKELTIKNFPNMGFNVWSHSEGVTSIPLQPTKNKKRPVPNIRQREVPNLFAYIRECMYGSEDKIPSSNIFVLRDLDKLFSNPLTSRFIRDLKEPTFKGSIYNNPGYNPIIVIAPTDNIPTEVARLFRVIDYTRPDYQEIEKIVVAYNNKLAEKSKTDDDYKAITDEEVVSTIKACLGLTEKEIRMLLSESIVKENTIDLSFISKSKINAVKKSGVLDYKIPSITLKDIGGNKAIVKWLNETKLLFTPEAQEFGIDKPKGFMAVGVPGAGKTAIAEAFAGELNIPLLSLSMDKIMNRMVGESEKKITQALDMAKSCAPCVLLLDEAEKMLGGKRLFCE